MAQLSVLLEESVQVAWDYLERSNEIQEASSCSLFLSKCIEEMIRKGVRSRLLLSNRAISQYRQATVSRPLEVAS
ncbi:MAG: hypothetical protein EOO27_15630 [Comamonadaceae bacterium]|nr:MAG: hypothetical protein EOO27_15630 [Comamonadaceae bacterium]